jgi:hypothetical protein
MSKLVSGDELGVGDVVVFSGHSHRITSIEPYDHPMLGGPNVRIAREEPTGWAITLTPEIELEVVR